MVIISTSREVSTTIDRVWDIIADVDNEPMYWHIGAFRNCTSRQIVLMNPKKSVETKLIEGPITGTRVITLSSSENNRTKIDVFWNIELSFAILEQDHKESPMGYESPIKTMRSFLYFTPMKEETTQKKKIRSFNNLQIVRGVK